MNEDYKVDKDKAFRRELQLQACSKKASDSCRQKGLM